MNKTINKLNLNTFDDFYAIMPNQIRDYIDRCKGVLQSAQWHPETDVYTHIKVVFNRAKRTGDINLMLAAIFHDLGKATTTEKHPTIDDRWSSKLHEKVSARLVKENKEWIETLDGNFDIILFIVDQHMRAKRIDEMRSGKRKVLVENPFYTYLEQFLEFDNMRIDYSNDID